MDFSPVGRVCSFCGLIGTAETRFAGGLGAMMCQDCVDVYYEWSHSPEASQPEGVQKVSTPPWNQMTDTEMLSTLPLIAANAEQVNKFMGDWIGLLRERNLSWAAIGKAMGISRQAAWERFTRDSGKGDKASTG